jgi:hypothetical protein
MSGAATTIPNDPLSEGVAQVHTWPTVVRARLPRCTADGDAASVACKGQGLA